MSLNSFRYSSHNAWSWILLTETGSVDQIVNIGSHNHALPIPDIEAQISSGISKALLRRLPHY